MKLANMIKATVAYQTWKAKNIAQNAYVKKRNNQKQKTQNTLVKAVVKDQAKEMRVFLSPMDLKLLLQR